MLEKLLNEVRLIAKNEDLGVKDERFPMYDPIGNEIIKLISQWDQLDQVVQRMILYILFVGRTTKEVGESCNRLGIDVNGTKAEMVKAIKARISHCHNISSEAASKVPLVVEAPEDEEVPF